MTTTALLAHIDRNDRRRARAAAGSALSQAGAIRDHRIIHWGTVIRRAFTVKPAGMSIPEGVVVLAVRRDEHGRCHGLLAEAYEGDRVGFASFPRLAQALGATEFQIGVAEGTMLDRIIAVRQLRDSIRFEREELQARPLVVDGAFDRSAIMAAACATARARREITGEPWAACLSVALKATWVTAKAARLAAVQ